MAKFAAVLFDTFLEIRAGKIFWVYWIVTAVVILVFSLLPGLEVNGQKIIGGDAFAPEMINYGIAMFFNSFFGFMLFLMVFGSAGLIPAYLSKGRAELALSKPMNRYILILNKFAAIFIIMAVIFALSSGLLWGLLSFQLEHFSAYFFYGLLLAFVKFFIIYGIVFFLGIAFNSPAAAIMGYFVIWIFSKLMTMREFVTKVIDNKIYSTILDTLYHIFPKFDDISGIFVTLISGQGINNWYPIWSSVLFSVALILLGLLIFNRRDF